jgi:hypothetical protein
MGVRVLESKDGKLAALYCDSTDWSFGPLFRESADWSARDLALAFIHWLPRDARTYSDAELERLHWEWTRDIAEKTDAK